MDDATQTTVDLAVIKQHLETITTSISEVKDNVNKLDEKIDRVETQTRKTNGSVATAMKDIALLQEKHDSCQARKYWEINPTRKDWKMFFATSLSSVITAVVIFIILKILGK